MRWPRELLVVLALTPPFLGLVFEPDGMRHELGHQARSLLAIWMYVMTLGLGIQLVTDRAAAREPPILVGPAGAARHIGIVLTVVLVTTAALAFPLIWTCPGLDGRIASLAVRGAALSTIYVIVGRLYQGLLQTRQDAATAQARAERELADARYQALVARTQPHFLHNALGTAAGLIARDPDAAERILRDLGALFRDIVSSTERTTVRAADELETARRYLEIQRLRFAPRLSVEILDEPLAHDELVPPLVFLPFVENAVLHGLSHGGTTKVRVELALEPNHVRFVVEDDGPGLGRSAHAEGTGIGTSDVRARLTTLYGNEASVEVGAAAAAAGGVPRGVVVSLRIPREEP